MLLGNCVLATVARVWRHRERVEWEAADQFARLAVELEHVDADPAVIELATRAAADERTHAAMCRALVDQYGPELAPQSPSLGGQLGPRHAARDRRTLYACVAMSCVTETLSAALLLQMRDRAKLGLVRDTVHHILKDEIDHSRLGWAHLAAEAQRTDVSWLGAHIGGMLRGAMASDLEPMGQAAESVEDLSAFGILSAAIVQEVYLQTVSDVIEPGFARFGIRV